MFIFNPLFPNATNDQKWDQIRLWRDAELKVTDWTQLPDAPVNKEVWAQYRQELRNLPANFEKADDVILPTKPNA